MYVCICNAVTEDAVHTCLSEGARNTREVRDGCGMKPGCGSCTRILRSMVSDYLTASELLDAMTGGPVTLEAVPDLVEVGRDTTRIERAA